MLKYAINDLKSNNKTKVILWCLKDNLNARKFYEKNDGKLLCVKTFNLENKLIYTLKF